MYLLKSGWFITFAYILHTIYVCFTYCIDINIHFMFKYSKDGISVLTILDTRRAKKSGQFPVKVQVVYRRKQKYYSTGKEVSKECPRCQTFKSGMSRNLRIFITNARAMVFLLQQNLVMSTPCLWNSISILN